MNFLSPAFLIGLPLVAVPVVIHLLSRRQQKKISWGAMRFLMQAVTRKRRLWRLTDLLLLLLRTAGVPVLHLCARAAAAAGDVAWRNDPARSHPGAGPIDVDVAPGRKRDALFELQIQKARRAARRSEDRVTVCGCCSRVNRRNG